MGSTRCKWSLLIIALHCRSMGFIAQTRCAFMPKLLFMFFFRMLRVSKTRIRIVFFKKSHLINESPPKSGYRQMRLEKSVWPNLFSDRFIYARFKKLQKNWKKGADFAFSTCWFFWHFVIVIFCCFLLFFVVFCCFL